VETRNFILIKLTRVVFLAVKKPLTVYGPKVFYLNYATSTPLAFYNILLSFLTWTRLSSENGHSTAHRTVYARSSDPCKFSYLHSTLRRWHRSLCTFKEALIIAKATRKPLLAGAGKGGDHESIKRNFQFEKMLCVTFACNLRNF
jgi:hypothetical protein